MKDIKILIVENEAIIAQDLQMKVTEMGYSGFSVGSCCHRLHPKTLPRKKDLQASIRKLLAAA